MLHNRLRAASAAGSGLSYYDEVISDSPLSYWRLEETSGSSVADEQGVRTGTVFGANLNTTGLIGSAAMFDGSNDYIAAGNTVANMSSTTVEAIINTSTKLGIQLIMSSDNYLSLNNRGWQLALGENTGLITFTKVANGYKACIGTTDLSVGGWYHVVGTYDGSNLRVYVNGVLENTEPTTGNITGTESPLEIGRYSRDQNRYFNGIIDEPAFYASALSDARILAHAQAAGLA